MSSGGRGRSNKGSKGGTDRSNGGGSTLTHHIKSDHNHNENDRESAPHKIAPTADQLRLAQMIDITHPEKMLQEKICQVMQVTGVSTDDASVALHDCDYDVNAAIDALLEGEDQGEWRESTKKKKRPPTAKSKEEAESNKENRRLENNREKSGSRARGGGGGGPRFRGRGGGRGLKDDTIEGFGRGSWSRRGRMPNGMPSSRGRGARVGRGLTTISSRTFQKRQQQQQSPGFTDTIDTWGSAPDKLELASGNLQIDTWDEEKSTTATEDWDSEWTGSLDKTTVFGPSTSVEAGTPPPTAPNIPQGPNHSVPSSLTETVTSVLSAQAATSPGTGVSLPQQPPPTMAQQQPSQPPHSPLSECGILSIGSTAAQIPPTTPAVAPSSSGITQPQTIDLAALLQKATPRSTLGALPPTSMVDGTVSGLIPASSLGMDTKPGANLLSGISSQNVNEGMKPSGLLTSSGSTSVVPSSAPNPSQQSYSPSPSISNSIFSNSVANLGSSLNSASGVSKVLSLSSQNSSFTSRSKPPRSRLSHSSSKIPSKAVEMPEVAMAALDMQFTGLEFGAPETFDFSPEKPLMGSTLVSGSSVSTRADPSSSSVSASKELSGMTPTISQPQPSYSNSTSSGVSNSNYSGSSVNSSSGAGNNSQPAPGYGSSFSTQVSVTSGHYQNNYVGVSSHSLPAMNVSKSHASLKDSSQNYTNDTSGTTSNMSGSLSTSGGGSSSGSGLSVSLNPVTTSSVQPSKPPVPGKTVSNLGGSIPPGVQQHSVSQQQQQHHQMTQQQLSQHHQSHHHLQQQQQQPVAQQTQQLMAGPSQYVSPQQAALQGALPPPFYNVQQPALYSFEDLQLLQQRIPHMPQAPSSLPGGREGAITSPPSYSVAEANKFRTDQNSSPVPSTINQQGAAAGATYITAPGNAGMPPFYMMPAVPSTFSQYGAPTLIPIPSNTHTGSTTTQFPGPPKIPYAQTSTYYDSMSQPQDYKTGYGSGSQGQAKTGPNSSGSASNSGSDLGYKNHLGKVSRPYEKPAFHTGTPPPFNLPGSGTSPMAANFTPMFIPTMPAAAQHHSPLIHHQLHQDAGSSGGQRTSAAAAQNKGGSKGAYSGSYWTN